MATRDISASLHWFHNKRDGVSNHQRLDCLLNRLFRHRTKKTPKLRVTGLCEGNPPVTGGFPSQSSVTRKKLPFDDIIVIRWIHKRYPIIVMNNKDVICNISQEMCVRVCVLFCFVVVLYQSAYPGSPSGLLFWQKCNVTIAPVPVQKSWRMWINKSPELAKNWLNHNTTTQNKVHILWDVLPRQYIPQNMYTVLLRFAR